MLPRSSAPLPDVRSLHGIHLRNSFAAVRLELGEPTTSHASAISRGESFASYAWHEASPPIAVLTWVVADGEFVWGVRVLGDGPIDPELGFGVGSTRTDVAARFPDAQELAANDMVQELADGTLVVKFLADRVVEIRLQAPMGRAKSD